MNSKKLFNLSLNWTTENKITATIFLLACTIIGIIQYRQYLIYKKIKHEHAEITNFIESKQPMLDNKNRLIKLTEELEAQNKIVRPCDLPITKVLKSVSTIIPHECALSEIAYDQNKKVTLKGLVKSNTILNQFITKLTNHAIFPITELKNVKFDDQTKYLNFEIDIHI